MNAEVQTNVGASQEAVVAQPEKTTLAAKAKEMVCNVCDSVKEFSQEIWEDQEGRKLLTDLAIAIGVRLAFKHPLTAGIAIGIVGYRAWQEIKNSLADSNNH